MVYLLDWLEAFVLDLVAPRWPPNWTRADRRVRAALS